MKFNHPQRGSLLIQSVLSLLIGALLISGIVYFIGYINRAKVIVALEQVQGLFAATVNEAARPGGADIDMVRFVSTNNFAKADWNNLAAPSTYMLRDVDPISVKPVGGLSGADTSALNFSITPTAPNSNLDGQVLVKALNAGFILAASSSMDSIGLDPGNVNNIPLINANGFLFTPGIGYTIGSFESLRAPVYFVMIGYGKAAIIDN